MDGPNNEPRLKDLIPATLSVVGAICGALITNTIAQRPGLNLVGAALGAAVAPTIAATGPFTRIRISLGLLMTAAALLITYGGFTVYDQTVSAAPPVLPPPPWVETTDSSPTSSSSVTDSPIAPSIEPPVASPEFSADSVECDSNDCNHAVTITSRGAAGLLVSDIELDGEKEHFAFSTDCIDKSLGQDESCHVSITYAPGALDTSYKARLLIHHGLSGEPATISLTGISTEPDGCTWRDENNVGIRMCTAAVECKPTCDGPIVVKSVGSEPLKITSLAFAGDDWERFSTADETDCEGVSLAPGESCNIQVHYEPVSDSSSSTDYAQLVINQNLAGDATYVALTGLNDGTTTTTPSPTDPPTTCVAGTKPSSTCSTSPTTPTASSSKQPAASTAVPPTP